MENSINNFRKKIEEIFQNYKLQAEKNINLGNDKQNKPSENDALLFYQMLDVFGKKINALADEFEKEFTDLEIKRQITVITKTYIFKYFDLFTFIE